jgi:hypothetical protein
MMLHPWMKEEAPLKIIMYRAIKTTGTLIVKKLTSGAHRVLGSLTEAYPEDNEMR